jgi:hypothetical protein
MVKTFLGPEEPSKKINPPIPLLFSNPNMKKLIFMDENNRVAEMEKSVQNFFTK